MTKPPVEVSSTSRFDLLLKRLRKKYAHITDDLKPLLEALEQGQTPGDQIPDVGHSVYKVRLPNRDTQRGKSDGYRVVYYIKTPQRIILIEIYAKSEYVNISSDEIRRLIEEILRSDS
jgi:mRNA-degrading endonuclease RelE of RelBE toxin-antitoxin system